MYTYLFDKNHLIQLLHHCYQTHNVVNSIVIDTVSYHYYLHEKTMIYAHAK